jgi:uncharacterized protein (DUF58 family)
MEPAARRRRPLQVFRIASLLLPSAFAWEAASMTLKRTTLDDAVAELLAPLWLATLALLVLRAIDARRRRAAGWLDSFEVLTASGSSLAWTGALAVVASLSFGWASLSVVGLFGLCTLHVVVLWTLVRARGADPWRRASLARRFVPEMAVEGEAVIEEVRLAAPRVPVGFRLFAKGRIGPRWPVSRYVVASGDSSGEVRLESDVGPAVRGTHDGEPLEVWLEDVLGLSRSLVVRCGEARVTVTPRPAVVDGAREVLSAGGDDGDPRTALPLPTSGSANLREYQPGDDARRIHWLRSLSARQIVVRLPDERPPERPAVRLVLDTQHPALAPPVGPLACRGPDELLDALVRVWLGVARALVDRGIRVTLVAVTPRGDGELAPAHAVLRRGAFLRGAALGARVAWHHAWRAAQLFGDEASIVVSHRLPADDGESAARWIVVPADIWTEPPRYRGSASLLLPHPPGSADNRRLRRRDAFALQTRQTTDTHVFRARCAHSQDRRAGNFVARRLQNDRVRLELLS